MWGNCNKEKKSFTLYLIDLYYVWGEVTIDVNSVLGKNLKKLEVNTGFQILFNSDSNFPLRKFRRRWDGEEIQTVEGEAERGRKRQRGKEKGEEERN